MNDVQRRRRDALRPLVLAAIRGAPGSLNADDLMFALQGVRPPPSDSLVRSLLRELEAAGLVRRETISRPSAYLKRNGDRQEIWREAHVYTAGGASP